jgi:hypothetical protein
MHAIPMLVLKRLIAHCWDSCPVQDMVLHVTSGMFHSWVELWLQATLSRSRQLPPNQRKMTAYRAEVTNPRDGSRCPLPQPRLAFAKASTDQKSSSLILIKRQTRKIPPTIDTRPWSTSLGCTKYKAKARCCQHSRTSTSIRLSNYRVNMM